MRHSKTVHLYYISDNANICTRSEYFITVKLFKNLRFNSLEKRPGGARGARDGLARKSTDYSPKGPRFNSQRTYKAAHNCL